MKGLTLIIWLCLGTVPALAQNAATTSAVPSPCAAAVCRAPAPLIGLGLPAAFAVGGVLLGAKLLKRSRRS
jgi:hypothetical protein